MPVIQRFSSCRVAIATMEILHGKVAAREITDVLAWARTNQAMLARKFEELQQ